MSRLNIIFVSEMIELSKSAADSGFVEVPRQIFVTEGAELISHTSTSEIYKVVYGGIRRVLKVASSGNPVSGLYSDMLLKELEILSNLSHPGVVMPVGTQSVSDGREGILLEWIDGETLDSFLSNDPDRQMRYSLAIQLLDIVAYLHSKGVVHRDIKPANLMVTHDGARLKIIDFNLADMPAYMRLKFPAGTEGYMSEHQKTTCSPSITDDLYAIGTVLEDILNDKASKKIAKRCREGYYERASDIADALKKARRRPMQILRGVKIALIAMTACGLVILVSANIFTRKLDMQREAMSADMSRQQAQAQIERQKYDSIHREDSLSLQRMKEERELERQKEAEHEAKVGEIYRGGETGIDRIWRNSDNIGNTYDLHMESQEFVHSYIAKHSDSLSDTEVTTLERLMNNRWKKHSDSWRRIHQDN